MSSLFANCKRGLDRFGNLTPAETYALEKRVQSSLVPLMSIQMALMILTQQLLSLKREVERSVVLYVSSLNEVHSLRPFHVSMVHLYLFSLPFESISGIFTYYIYLGYLKLSDTLR